MMTDTATIDVPRRYNERECVHELRAADNALSFASEYLGRGGDVAERLHQIRQDLAELEAELNTEQGRSQVLTEAVEAPTL